MENKFKDYGQVDFEDHEIEIIEEQDEKTNKQLEELGIK